MDDFIERLEAIWNKLGWNHVKLIVAGGCWGSALIMFWQHFDSMANWPLPAIIVCAIMWIGIGCLLFESAME